MLLNGMKAYNYRVVSYLNRETSVVVVQEKIPQVAFDFLLLCNPLLADGKGKEPQQQEHFLFLKQLRHDPIVLYLNENIDSATYWRNTEKGRLLCDWFHADERRTRALLLYEQEYHGRGSVSTEKLREVLQTTGGFV